MKRRVLIKHLKKNRCKFLREGKKHTIYFNPKLRKVSTIPRHTEISDKLARKICKDLGVPPL
ncbi:MAG: type II toxin-antitoxin system HicA family toxin [Thermoplasmata archaeon]|nr:MAG: type II toxin-antitoxin system HicA family toxin [Thermoplasmata archaeon]